MSPTGWPRIRWRFRIVGRNIVSVNKNAIALGKARMTTEVSEIGAATQIVSCGTPLPGLTVKNRGSGKTPRSGAGSHR